MKKIGFISLVIYALLALTGGIFAIWSRLELDALAGSADDGWASIGAAIVFVLALIVLAVSLVALIFKILHVATGWGFFGFLCLLIDLAIVALAVYSMITSIPSGASFDFAENLPLIAITGIFGVSFLSNLSSLGS